MPTKIVFIGGGEVEVKADLDEAVLAVNEYAIAQLDLHNGDRRVAIRREAVAYLEEAASREGHFL